LVVLRADGQRCQGFMSKSLPPVTAQSKERNNFA
jgi:hypothetical protein